VTAAWSQRHEDQEEKGYLIQQVSERLFPDQGEAVTETRNQWMEQKNAEFMPAASVGYKEMIEPAESPGQKILRGLMDHVCQNY